MMGIKTLDKKDYVDVAEKVIRSLGTQIPNKPGSYKFLFTTSKLRNILAMVTSIYNDVIHASGTELDEDMQSRIQYLRMRIVYEAGRDPKGVKPFVEKSGLLEHLKNIGNSKEKFLIFCHYVEALVAYRRFYGHDE